MGGRFRVRQITIYFIKKLENSILLFSSLFYKVEKYSFSLSSTSCFVSSLFISSLTLLESFKFFKYQHICFLISLTPTYSPFSNTAKFKCSRIIFSFSFGVIGFIFSPFSPSIISYNFHGDPQCSSSYHYPVYTCVVKHFLCIF